MSRLTQWTPKGASLILDDPQNNIEAAEQVQVKAMKAWNKLAMLEDAEEQGRLVILPVKPGDSLYLPHGEDYEETVLEYDYTGHLLLGCNCYSTQGSYQVPLSGIGKSIFLTREEAEAALEETT